MCFVPQRRALFRHLNFQKWSENGVLCTCSLRNVLRARTACTFSTSQLPKVVRPWCVLYILTWTCASRHNGVHFFISHLASWLRTRRFSEPTFRPSGATNHWKNAVFCDFPTFSRTWIFFLPGLSLLWSAVCYSSLLSASSHLCFSSVHIVGSLTSKLPSTISIFGGDMIYIPLNLALKNSHWRHKNGSLRLPGCLHNRDENRCTIDFCVFSWTGLPQIWCLILNHAEHVSTIKNRQNWSYCVLETFAMARGCLNI